MSMEKKAAPGVASTGDGNGQQTNLSGFDLSSQNHITAFTPTQGSAASFLGHARENTLHDGDIDAVIDLYSPALTFKVISWDEAVDLCRLSFSLGYGAVIWQNKEVDADG